MKPATFKVLVTDAEQRASLASIRNLGRNGYEVHAISSHSSASGFYSSYVAASYSSPDALSDPVGFASFVRQVVRDNSISLVLPITEASSLALLLNAGDSEFELASASREAFLRAADKAESRSHAASCGIPVPKQLLLSDPNGYVSLETFPIAIKPYRSVSIEGESRQRGSVSYASDSVMLKDSLQLYSEQQYPLLLQEKLVGPGYGVSMLVWDGRLLAVSAHRRLHEKPLTGGVSVLSETVDISDSLIERCHNLLLSLGYRSGVAMVELKGHNLESAGFIEINPRLWGSVQLAIDAGVDFPALLVEAAMGRANHTLVKSRPGHRLRWFWGEVDHLIARLKKGVDANGIPGRWNRITAIRDFLIWKGGRNSREEMLRADDIRPFCVETINWLRRR